MSLVLTLHVELSHRQVSGVLKLTGRWGSWTRDTLRAAFALAWKCPVFVIAGLNSWNLAEYFVNPEV